MRFILLATVLFFIISCGNKQTDSKQITKTDSIQVIKKSITETKADNLTGDIDSLIIEGTVYNLLPISKSTFNNMLTNEFIEPDMEIIDDTANVTRHDLNLTFKLFNGTDTTLTNDTTESWSKYIDYQFLKSFDIMNYWLLSLTFYEGFSYELVDKETGEEITIWSIPVFSPGRKKFICYSFDMEAGYNPNGIQYFKIVDKKIENIWNKDISDWGPSKIKWANDSILYIEQKVMTPDTEEFYTTYYKSIVIK